MSREKKDERRSRSTESELAQRTFAVTPVRRRVTTVARLLHYTGVLERKKCPGVLYVSASTQRLHYKPSPDGTDGQCDARKKLNVQSTQRVVDNLLTV